MQLREDVLGLNFLWNHCVASKVSGSPTSPPVGGGHRLRQKEAAAHRRHVERLAVAISTAGQVSAGMSPEPHWQEGFPISLQVRIWLTSCGIYSEKPHNLCLEKHVLRSSPFLDEISVSALICLSVSLILPPRIQCSLSLLPSKAGLTIVLTSFLFVLVFVFFFILTSLILSSLRWCCSLVGSC